MFTIDIRPSSELMLALDAIVTVGNRIAAAMEVANKTQYQRGDGPTAPAAMPVPAVKATPAVLAVEPVKPPANVVTAPAPAAAAVQRPSVPGSSIKHQQPFLVHPEGRLFSPDRDEIIRREWPKGTPVSDILAMLHELPGRQIEGRRLGIHAASNLGLRRPEKPSAPITQRSEPNSGLTPTAHAAPESRIDVMRRIAAVQSARPMALPPTGGHPIPREPMPEVMRMDAIGVLRWAGQRGLSVHLPISDEDMSRVNAKAKAIGHPPIVYAPSSRPEARQ